MNTGSFRLEFQAPLFTQPLFQESAFNTTDQDIFNQTTNHSNLISIPTKIFQGSDPNSKIVSIQQHQNSCSNQLFLLKIQQKKIEFRRLNSKRTYDSCLNDFVKVIAHPNGKRFSILRKHLFLNYYIEPAILQNHINIRLFDNIEAITGQYNPSAEYIGGLAMNLTSNIIVGFKYNLSSQKFSFTSNSCEMNNGTLQRKWKIKFNQNMQNIGVVTSNSGSFCIVDYSIMKISSVVINESFTKNSVKQIGNVTDTSNLLVSDSVFLNDNNGGFYLLLDTRANIALRYQISSLDKVSLTHFFSYLSLPQNRTEEQSSSCLEISSFTGLACFMPSQNKIHFMKLNFGRDLVENVGSLYLDHHSWTSQIHRSRRNFIQDIIYDSQTSKLCALHNLQFKCITLTTNCDHNQTFLPVSDCNRKCRLNSSTLFWNHSSNQCDNCTSCICPNNYQIYEFNEKRCVRDCSSIKNAVNYSQYHHSQKCMCQNEYLWNQNLKQCVYKNKNIPFSKNNFYYYRPFTPKCSYPYRSVNKTSDNINGHCVLFCQNGKQPQMRNSAPICECPRNHVWNSSKFICTPLEEKDHLKFPISLMVFLLLFLAVGIFFCGCFLWKRYKRKIEEKKNDEEGAAQSDRKFRSNVKTNEQLKMIGSQIKLQVCQACFKHNPQPNCMGICGHYFHFDCVKQKINLESKCPKCNKQFPNGVESLKLVEADQIFSIAESS